MDMTDSCKLCEKIVITLETDTIINDPLNLPNTYDVRKKTHGWRFHEFMAYALVPHVNGSEARSTMVEMFLCIDEDDLDDLDVAGYAKKFFCDKILPDWKHVKKAHFSKPVLAHSDDLECRKLKVYQRLFTP